jgi:hypothetical protein
LAAMSLEKTPYFYVPCCPSPECTTEAFKRAQVWGWTRDEAKQRLITHLMRSGHHMLPKEDAEVIAADVELEEDEYKTKPQEQPQRKRQKGPQQPQEPPADIVHRAVELAVHNIAMGTMACRDVASGSGDTSYVEHVNIRSGDFMAAIDCTVRATAAARQAQKLAQAASRAFADEVAALDSVRTMLETIAVNNGLP